jgi:tight adherence protein B
MMALAIALLIFLAIVILVVGLWWVAQGERSVRARLKRPGPTSGPDRILRTDAERSEGALGGLLGGTGLMERLSDLVTQSGYKGTPSDVVLIILAFGIVGGAGGWLRTGTFFWGLLAGVAVGSLPMVYLLYRRKRRLSTFQTQFPDALDTITRAIRAGNALSGAIRVVAEDMPDPVGEEFRRVDEEIRLGMDPGEALFRLQKRVPVEDMGFFCTAIKIQRGVGGNLAEVLDRLAEVIRERFKILSYARVLSAQHRYAAICIGLSPAIFAVVFEIMHPGYFDALQANPIGPWLVGAGLILEAIGFFMVWRIAQIKV